MIDLHMHSTCSDGEMSPEALVQWGKDIWLTAMAISDHDTTVGSLRAMDHWKKIWQKVISAVEISTSYKNHVFHLLAYDFPYSHPELSRKLSELQLQRTTRAEIIIFWLNEDLTREGLRPIDPSEILKLGIEKPITRPDIAQYLLKNNYITSLQEAFDRWLWKYKLPNKDFPISEAIDLVRSVGWVAVLAHPFAESISLKAIDTDVQKQKEMVQELHGFGLDGLEIYRFWGNPEMERIYWEIAKNFWMITTWGSDFHGKSYESIARWIGENNVPDTIMDEIHRLSVKRR